MHNGPIYIYVGDAMSENTNRTPMPSNRNNPEPSQSAQGVWLEAECGNVGSLWDTRYSSTAAKGRYVTVTDGNNSADSAPSTNGQISLNFNLSSSGAYGIWGRVRAPSYTGDSFWLQVNNGSWINWNNLAIADEWTWKR
jgi:hypothetical protein